MIATRPTYAAARLSCQEGVKPETELVPQSIAGMDPPDMTVNSFGIIPPPPGVATVVPVDFAQKC